MLNVPIPLLLKSECKVLTTIAAEAVSYAEAQGGAWRDKRENAYDYAMDALKKQGVEVAVNVLNGALENEVAKLHLK